jgi:hypothetical protein
MQLVRHLAIWFCADCWGVFARIRNVPADHAVADPSHCHYLLTACERIMMRDHAHQATAQLSLIVE